MLRATMLSVVLVAIGAWLRKHSSLRRNTITTTTASTNRPPYSGCAIPFLANLLLRRRSPSRNPRPRFRPTEPRSQSASCLLRLHGNGSSNRNRSSNRNTAPPHPGNRSNRRPSPVPAAKWLRSRVRPEGRRRSGRSGAGSNQPTATGRRRAGGNAAIGQLAATSGAESQFRRCPRCLGGTAPRASTPTVDNDEPAPSLSSKSYDAPSRRSASPPAQLPRVGRLEKIQPSIGRDVPTRDTEVSKPLASRSQESNDRLLMARKSPNISIETTGPRRISVGKEAAYQISVENAGEFAAEDVVVYVDVPPGRRWRPRRPRSARRAPRRPKATSGRLPPCRLTAGKSWR